MKNEYDLLTAFETFLLTEKRVSNNTFVAYKKDIQQLVQYFHTKKLSLESATKADLKKFLTKYKRAGAKARTISRKICAYKKLYNYLSCKHRFTNHGQGLIFPKLEKTLPIYLTEDEIERLFKAASRDQTPRGVRNKIILMLLYSTGMRISELLDLTIDQIHFDTGFIQVTGKGNKERSIPLPDAMMRSFKSYLDNEYKRLGPDGAINTSNHVFVSFYHNALHSITRQSYWIILRKILAFANITKKVSPHTLRHSLATHLLKNGANLRSLQLLLGHERLSTIQIYTHLQTEQLRKIYDKKHPRA